MTGLNSDLYAQLLGDAELAGVLSDEAFIARMIAVERALARAQGGLGVISHSAAQGIDEGLAGVVITPSDLAQGVAQAGVPVPALVAALRSHLDPEAANALHWGATSQDIVDTAHVLGFKSVFDVMETRLTALLNALSAKSETYADTLMAGRTRGQISTPITFGLRIAQWAAPVVESLTALPSLRAQVLRVQFGGASGANTAVAPHGPAIAQALAQELGLHESPPWHTNRLPITLLADWLMSINTALTKLASDLALMSRTEIAEVTAGAGGGSSTMPQKQNPVSAETVQVLSTLAQGGHSALHQAAAHAEERDGANWPVEWIALPQLCLATGAVLRHGIALAQSLTAHPEAMMRNLTASYGVLAERASFLLAAQMPRADAQALVKEALKSDQSLAASLSKLSDAPIDWESALDLRLDIPACQATSEQIWATWDANPAS